eukprot:TRINITY_DN7898_c0_g1_i1.p1 TRINITY_DN7898_c0_g1~~TRINITY_DN7898_c0_g1_i1.p1  ORF type:complete len:206 (-),score=31.96 TRINITY_DN7898_c0_g1_i1:26-643(-)
MKFFNNKATVKKSKLKREYSLKLHDTWKNSLRVTGSIRDAVRLPSGEDKTEWIAMNTMELFNTLKLVHGFTTEFCNEKSCPKMTAGPAIEFLWGESTKKPQSLPAPSYIALLFDWISAKFEDNSVFPVEGEFPKNFINEVKVIMKRMFRVYAHMYHHHLTELKNLDALSHVNTCFKHFYYFVVEFDLVKDSDMAPLKSLITKLKL